MRENKQRCLTWREKVEITGEGAEGERGEKRLVGVHVRASGAAEQGHRAAQSV